MSEAAARARRVSLSPPPARLYPGQPWLLEVLRSYAAAQYAHAVSVVRADIPQAVHRAAIDGAASTALGPVISTDISDVSISRGIDLLIMIGDLAHIGHGYFVPRESRVVRMSRNFGRIAGGLPLTFIEHTGAQIADVHTDTLGRIVPLPPEAKRDSAAVEHATSLRWEAADHDDLFSRLAASLPAKPVSASPDGSVAFYSVASKRTGRRTERWQPHDPGAPFIVARSTHLPRQYFVCLRASRSRSLQWFEVPSDSAREWLLLAEKTAGVTNRIRGTHLDSGLQICIPNILPKSVMRAVLVCASNAVPIDGGWDILVPTRAVPAAAAIFRSANLEVI